MSSELFVYLLGLAVVGLTTWGAIRADIKHMHREIAEAKDIGVRAHDRIDEILLREIS